MREIKYIIFAIGVMMSLQFVSGCSRDVAPIPEVGDAPEIAIDGQMVAIDGQQNVSTKINTSSFDDGDQISFYAVKYNNGSPSVLGADANTYLKNNLYKRDNGMFKSFDGTAFVRQFFPSDGSWVDLYGVYPYNSVTPTDYTAYKFAVKTDQSTTDKSSYFASDLLMAKHGAIAPTAIPNKMVFNHLFSRIVINAKTAKFTHGEVVTSIKFIKPKTSATVNLRAYDPVTDVAGAVTAVSDPLDIVPLVQPTQTMGYNITTVVIMPCQLLPKNQAIVEITLSNKAVYQFQLTEDLQLKAGMETVFNITVDFGDQFEIVGSPVTVVPWGTLEFNAHAAQESDDKFHIALTNKDEDVTSVTNVKLGVVGSTGLRTFDLPLTKNGGAVVDDLYFEFAGVGNRPNGYPFSIATLEMINAGGVTVGTKLEIDEADRIKVTAPALTELVYDMTTEKLTKKL